MRHLRHDMTVKGRNAVRLTLLGITVLCAGLFWCFAGTATSASGSRPLPFAATVPGQPAIAAERRVMFDEGHEWATSKAATDKVIDRLKSAGFNVYVPCVWHGRGTTWPSKLAYADSRLPQLSWSGHDPLAYLLEKAHAAGIEVHPWFTVVRRDDNIYRQFYDAATPKDAFDVHNRAFRQFIVELMLDVVQRYPVDGINLDYIRSMGDCACGQCVIDYRKRFGRELVADIAAKKARQPVPTLDQWHGEVVSEIVREVSARGRKLKPGLVISVDSFPDQEYVRAQGHDAISWANDGQVDVIYCMDYAEDLDLNRAKRLRQQLQQPDKFTLLVKTYDLVDQVRRPEQERVIGVAHGKTVIARSPETLVGYVLASRRELPGSGLAFYLEKFLADFQRDALRQSVYRDIVTAAWPATATSPHK